MRESEEVKLKETDVKILAELMKNSRRSDRDIAQSVGVSQPTVSRTIKRLEKTGVIKEFTIIPDFSKLGFEIMAITKFKLDEKPYTGRAKARDAAIQEYACLVAVEGSGKNANRAFINLYENFSEYLGAVGILREVPLIKADNIDSFLVDLRDRKSYRHLSMTIVANRLLQHLKDRQEC